MSKIKREWHNPAKYMARKTEGKCPYCNKRVKSLEGHVHDKHKKEKLIRKK